jgi:hypothetical protein
VHDPANRHAGKINIMAPDISSLSGELAALVVVIRKAKDEVRELADSRNALASAVEFLEWGFVEPEQAQCGELRSGVCPVCWQSSEKGHADRCAWAALFADGIEALANRVEDAAPRSTRPGSRERNARPAAGKTLRRNDTG